MFPSPGAEMEYLALKDKYGASALKRVDKLLTYQGKRDSFQQGAKFVMPDLLCKPWHNPYEYHELDNIIRKLEPVINFK